METYQTVNMAKRENPATSNEAHRSLKAEDIREVYQKIIKALERLGSASSEQISVYLTMDHCKIHKRTSEMEKLGMIFRPGHRVPTKSGRSAFVWALSSCGQKTDREKIIPGKSIQDYSKTIQEIQSNLF